jgi:hypothetical protein
LDRKEGNKVQNCPIDILQNEVTTEIRHKNII